MTDQMQVHIERREAQLAVVHLEGSLDMDGVNVLMETSKKLMSNGCRHLILNLAKITFLSSSGVGSLLVLSEDFEQLGGALTLVDTPPEVASVVRVLSLEDLLNFATQEEALARVSS